MNVQKTWRMIIIAAVAVVAVLSIVLAINWASFSTNTDDWETYYFPDEKFEQIFFECNDTPYNPEYSVISAQLRNNQNISGLTFGGLFTLVKQVESTWRIVPFKKNVDFGLISASIINGMSFDYSLRPEMLAVKLGEGQYRIVTDVFKGSVLSSIASPENHTVWADFSIDKNAPKQ